MTLAVKISHGTPGYNKVAKVFVANPLHPSDTGPKHVATVASGEETTQYVHSTSVITIEEADPE